MIQLDTGEPARIPGDFRRNSQGNPLVKHPTKNRDAIYDRPSKWFDDYTGIDPIYANRGQWIHRLLELIDQEESA